jgi:cell wall assembly regulator SMI1
MNEIEELLNDLKSKLDEDFSMLDKDGLLDEDDKAPLRHFFTFNPPAPEEEIEKLEQDLGIILPNDYRELLTIHNGMLLYSSYLAEVKYLSIEEIRQKYEEIQEFRFKHLDVEKNKDYPIALLMDVGYVMMKSSRIKNGSSNGAVVVGEIDEEETNMPFYTFLENTINTPFEYFWE